MPKKVSDDKKEQVRAVLMVNPDASCREIGKVVDMSYRTALDVKKDIIGNDVDDIFSQQRTIKKQEFINAAWELVSKTLKIMDTKLNMLKGDALTKVNVRDLAITMGTIYDKQALASGEPTQISESRKTVTELMADTESKMAELRKLVSGE